LCRRVHGDRLRRKLTPAWFSTVLQTLMRWWRDPWQAVARRASLDRLVSIDRRFLLYVPVLCGATGLTFLKSIVYARLFSVENFGALNQCLLFASLFSNFGSAGFQLLGHKLLPQYYARGDRQSAEELLGSALTVLGLAAALAAVTIAFAILAGALRGVALYYATLLFAIAQALFAVRLIDIKSEFRFFDHALLSSLRAVSLLALGAAVAALTRDVAATLATEGAVTLILAMPLVTGLRGGPVLRKALENATRRVWLAANLPAALRLLWLSGTVTLLYSLDRWAGIALLTKREYGIFALGLLVIVVFETLQMIVNVAAYPLMGRMIAHDQHKRAFRFATLATAVVAIVTAVFYVPFILSLDFLVRRYLPLYADATTVIKLAVIAGMLRLADFYSSFAVLCDRERSLTWGLGALIVVASTGILGAVSIGHARFNPNRMVIITVGVSACSFLLSLAVAARAQRRRTLFVLA
jgi:O-antigen/teichoic acid export membrane protein